MAQTGLEKKKAMLEAVEKKYNDKLTEAREMQDVETPRLQRAIAEQKILAERCGKREDLAGAREHEDEIEALKKEIEQVRIQIGIRKDLEIPELARDLEARRREIAELTMLEIVTEYNEIAPQMADVCGRMFHAYQECQRQDVFNPGDMQKYLMPLRSERNIPNPQKMRLPWPHVDKMFWTIGVDGGEGEVLFDYYETVENERRRTHV